MNFNEQDQQPNAYRVDDDNNIEEKDLRRTYLFGKGDDEKSGNEPGLEGDGYGGQAFGESNDTPAANDVNNPSEYAGNSNAYLSRTEPLEEHPEYNNFKDPNQLGQSNYAQAADAANTGQSDSENTGPQKDQDDLNADSQGDAELTYQEGTAEGEDDTNIPGPNEVPDQQKVGE